MILPVLHRELLVQSRHRLTHRLRFFAALSMLGITVTLLTASMIGGQTPQENSDALFVIESGLGLGWSLISGIILTSDCLGLEKREGTLGLLFLTDLRSLDILLGKAVAHGAQAAFATLATIPFIAFPIMLGGVSGETVWRMAALVAAAQLLSLSIGVFVSIFASSARSGMGVTAALIAGICSLPYCIVWALGLPEYHRRGFLLESLSPICALVTIRSPMSWTPIIWTAVLGSLFLATACARFARKRDVSANGDASGDDVMPSIDGPRRMPLFAAPYTWLTIRLGVGRVNLKILGIILWVEFAAALAVLSSNRSSFVPFAAIVFYVGHITIKSALAFAASERLGGDAASGALELLMVTPLSPREILVQHRSALVRRFQGVLTVQSLLNLFLFACFLLRESVSSFVVLGFIVTTLFGGILLLWSDAMALIEIGPLMALLHRRPGKSVVRSMIGVVAPGWISALLLFFCGKANVGEAQMLAMLCLLLAACLVVSVRSRDVARRQLVEWKFRTLAAEPNLWSSIARKSSNEPASTSLGLPPHCYETTAT